MAIDPGPGPTKAETTTRPDWRRPMPTRRDYRQDAVVAGILFAATLVSAWLYATVVASDDTAAPWVVVVWAAVIALSLAARRRIPEVVAVVVSLAFAALIPLSVPELLFSQICLFVALYSVGAWSTDRRRATVLRVLIVIGMFAWLFIDLYVRSLDPSQLPQLSRIGTVSPYAAFGLIQIIINLLYFGAAWYFGDTAFAAARQRAALEERSAELAAERARTSAQAVTLERVRIARELHDVVAHHVSVMGVQAGAARRIIERDPGEAAASISRIEQSARTAIEELHRMLGALRDDSTDGRSADGSPAAERSVADTTTRDLDQLTHLVDEASGAGVPTTLTVVGEPRPVPPTVGLSVYRIAQEALTNTRKHGGVGATAEVRLRYRPTAIEVEVSDTGAGESRRPSAPAGLGHVGMRERVSATGGSLEVGPRRDGGYLVRAGFPLSETDTESETDTDTGTGQVDADTGTGHVETGHGSGSH